MRAWIRSAVVFAALGLGLSPSARAAEDLQPIAPMVAIQINHFDSDIFASHHGYISVGDSVGGYAQYYWGGSRCPGLTFDARSARGPRRWRWASGS